MDNTLLAQHQRKLNSLKSEAARFAESVTAGLGATEAQRQGICWRRQIKLLSQQYMELAAELVALQPKRNPDLQYVSVHSADLDADVVVGFDFDPGEGRHITSAAVFSSTGNPGSPGYDATVDVSEVWLGGADIAPALLQSVVDDLAEQALAQTLRGMADAAEDFALREAA